MIIIISAENDFKNEINLLHLLFEVGLQSFHLRKPKKSLEEYKVYLNKISTKYHDRIVIHHFHELTEEYSLKGVHLQEFARNCLKEKLASFVEEHQKKGNTVSSSFHEPEVIENCEVLFDYHLLSPVFTAISKKNYLGRGFNVTKNSKNIVGMGGINEKTIPQTIALGYKGIGVLGGVWNTENPVESFKNIQNKYKVFLSDTIKTLEEK
ncbi:MAG: thiamine phosphate synthase [Cellulophaga sp.]